MNEDREAELIGWTRAASAAIECIIVALSVEKPDLAKSIHDMLEGGRVKIDEIGVPPELEPRWRMAMDERLGRYILVCSTALDAHAKHIKPAKRRLRLQWPWRWQ